MDDAVARSQFLFGLDEPPDDIESFFMERRIAEEELAAADELDDGPGSVAGMRTVVASMIAAGGGDIFWKAAQRLTAAGVDRFDALDQIAEALLAGLQRREPGDVDGLADFLEHGVGAYLDDLPVPDWERVAETVCQAATERPGLTLSELLGEAARRLAPEREAGAVLQQLVADVISEELDEFGHLGLLLDDRVVCRTAQASRAVLTHRVTAQECATDRLRHIDIDLGLLAVQLEPTTPDGHEIRITQDRGGMVWIGPPGWLAGIADGDLVAIRVAGADGVVHLEVVQPLDDASLAAEVRAAFGRLVPDEDGGTGVAAGMLLSAVLIERPDAFDVPRLPFGELVQHAGLRARFSVVGATEAQLVAAEIERRAARLEDAALDDAELARTAFDVLTALEAPGSSAMELRSALRRMGDGRDDGEGEPLVRDLVIDELIPMDAPAADPEVLHELADRLVGAAQRDDESAMAHWVAGIVAERTGHLEVADAHFVAAMIADADFEVAVDRAAWYASDRGDAATAARLWSSTGAAPIEDLAIARRYAAAGPKVGRNDPCWCGSGRKFKACHQGRPGVAPLPDRVAWIARKAAGYVLRRAGDVRDALVGNVIVLGSASGTPRERLAETALHPLPMDVTLTEDGWFARFLDERGSLLPDDERLLATSWLLVERSVYEIVSIERDATIDVRDARTGDLVRITERQLGRTARPGTYFCMRVVPDGGGHQIVGAVFPVPVGRVQEVLELCARGDARALCRWVGVAMRGPEVVTREGEAMVSCSVRFRVADRDAAGAALDGEYERDGDTWHEFVELDGDGRTLRAALHLAGDQLLVTTMSEERAERVIATIRRLLPDAVLTADERIPYSGPRPGSGDGLDDAGARLADLAGGIRLPEAELDELQSMMEQRWLTEPVPALGGLTPVQAAADPTRRDDLIRLLASFPTLDPQGPAFGLRPDRLRAALGLS